MFILIAGVLGAGFIFRNQVEEFVNVDVLGLERSDEIINPQFDNGLALHFISVGQGDAAVIVFPNGQVMMVDAGHHLRASRNAISEYLGRYIFPGDTPRAICLFVATHSHADHIGQLSYILDNYYIAHLIRPKSFTTQEIEANIPYTRFGIEGNVVRHDTATFRNAMSRAENHRCINGSPVRVDVPRAGKEIEIGGAAVRFYSPTRAFYTAEGINQLSTIFSVNFQGRRIMFTGDAYIVNENRILEIGADGRTGFGTLPGEVYRVDILAVSHHGSHTSTGADFLAKIQPRYSIIQVGAGNSYNHPHDVVINRLEAVEGNTILKTKIEGDILVQMTAAAMEVAGVIHDEYSFWIYYWMMAAAVIVVAFSLLLLMDFIPKNSKNKKKNNRNNNSRKKAPARR